MIHKTQSVIALAALLLVGSMVVQGFRVEVHKKRGAPRSTNALEQIFEVTSKPTSEPTGPGSVRASDRAADPGHEGPTMSGFEAFYGAVFFGHSPKPDMDSVGMALGAA